MNNKGQSLITFVLILPIIVLFLAFIIDSSVSIMNKTKIDGVIKSNMEISLNGDIDTNKLRKIIKENDNDLDVNSYIDNNILYVKVHANKKNIFGNILKLKYYELNFDYCANLEDKIIKENCR